jgi:uncharacterized damage-inducible protein DinB
MRSIVRLGTVVPLLLALTLPLAAQVRTGVMGDLIRDVTEVERKIVGLARAMPAETYDWRPGKGVRSASEVFMHVASDNYFLPAAMGLSAPAETGINGMEYQSAVAFEKRTLTRDQIIAELEKSFAFLKKAMADTPDDRLDTAIDLFGRKTTSRGTWITTTTHLHEHLGQLIAYARSSNVVPPWSK